MAMWNKTFIGIILLVLVFLLGCTAKIDNGSDEGKGRESSDDDLGKDLDGLEDDLGVENLDEFDEELNDLDSLDY